MSIKVERKVVRENGVDVPLNCRPDRNEIVRLKICGNHKEIRYSRHSGRGASIRKLNKFEYLDLRTGEIREFEKQEKRMDDTISVKRSLSAGRDLINANATDPSRCRWITLTYAENMTDPVKLYNDWKNFRKRLRFVYGDTEYITAAEPQARGAWHLHVLLIFPDKAPFIENERLRDLWKHGFVNVRALDDVDNVGAYLTAYLGDVPLDELQQSDPGSGLLVRPEQIRECDRLDEKGNHVPKRVVKGARLALYPAGMHIFRHSKGCLMPSERPCSAGEAEKEVSDMELSYESTKFITDTKTGYTNLINIRAYKPRKNGKGEPIHDSERPRETISECLHENQSETEHLPGISGESGKAHSSGSGRP